MDNISRDIFTNGIPEISDSFKENKVGFEKEGILRQHIFENGRFRDVSVMAILNSRRKN